MDFAATADELFNLGPRTAWIVTAVAEGRRSGLVATWVLPASLDPVQPMAMVGLAPTHFTTELVQRAGAFGLHLVDRTQAALALGFGSGSGRQRDKFEGLSVLIGRTGTPLLADCLGWLECQVVTQYDAGARLYFWADIVDSGRRAGGPPLTDHMLMAAADPADRQRLQEERQADTEKLRPLAAEWRARLL